MSSMDADAATDWHEIDRFEGGLGWIAYPDETMQRASHALVTDGEIWLVDPVDVPGLDDLLADLGEVAGVVLLLDRHKRDAAEIATRYGVAVHLPDFMAGVEDDLAAPVELFHRELGETGYAAHTVVDNFAWKEAALYNEDSGVLVVPEAVGTADYYLAENERLGVHPVLRLKPPRKLARLRPERILVGHGAGIDNEATRALKDAISGARSRSPALYLKTLKNALPV